MVKRILVFWSLILVSFAVAAAKNDGPKVQSWVEKEGYKESSFSVPSIAFIKYSADGKKIFTADFLGIFRELDVASGEISREIKTGLVLCKSCDYDEKEDLLVLASGISNNSFGYYLSCFSKGVLKYKKTFAEEKFYSGGGYCGNIISLDVKNGAIYNIYRKYNEYGYAGQTSGFVTIHNLADGSIRRTCGNDACDRMEVSPDKTKLILNKHLSKYLNEGGHGYLIDSVSLHCYDIVNDKWTNIETHQYMEEYISAISQDSRIMVTWKNSDTIVLRSMTDFNVVAAYHAPNISSIKLSTNEKMLIALNDDKSNDLFTIYDYKSGIILIAIKRIIAIPRHT